MELQNWQKWSMTAPSNFAETGSPRHLFMCGNGTEEEYAVEFPEAESGYRYTAEEQRSQWQVVLQARRWMKARYLMETKNIGLNAAYALVDAEEAGE